MRMLRRKRLTKKQGKLVRAVVADPSATLDAIGLQAGYAGRQQVHRALKAPAVMDALAKCREIMDQRDKLTMDALLTHLEDGLEATEIRSLKVDGEKMTASAEVKDFNVRHKYLTSAIKLRGLDGRDEASAASSVPLNIAIILAGGGSESEKSALADVLRAARMARGLHPTENRLMTPAERKEYGLD